MKKFLDQLSLWGCPWIVLITFLIWEDQPAVGGTILWFGVLDCIGMEKVGRVSVGCSCLLYFSALDCGCDVTGCLEILVLCLPFSDGGLLPGTVS